MQTIKVVTNFLEHFINRMQKSISNRITTGKLILKCISSSPISPSVFYLTTVKSQILHDTAYYDKLFTSFGLRCMHVTAVIVGGHNFNVTLSSDSFDGLILVSVVTNIVIIILSLIQCKLRS